MTRSNLAAVASLVALAVALGLGGVPVPAQERVKIRVAALTRRCSTRSSSIS